MILLNRQIAISSNMGQGTCPPAHLENRGFFPGDEKHLGGSARVSLES
jgi:hypothetical protein